MSLELAAQPTHPGPRTRYSEPWRALFLGHVVERLSPGIRVLDVGAGRSPVLPPATRPDATHYVGLDTSARELAAAPARSYDEVVVRDIGDHDSSLDDRFDLVVSWQALEHVDSVPTALETIRRYLGNEGRAVLQVSGSYSAFALANRMLPDVIGVKAISKLLHRDPDSVFKAHYDNCYYTALERALAAWRDIEIIPRFRGASYLDFSPPLRSLYLRYEDWAEAERKVNLATHYVIVADK